VHALFLGGYKIKDIFLSCHVIFGNINYGTILSGVKLFFLSTKKTKSFSQTIYKILKKRENLIIS